MFFSKILCARNGMLCNLSLLAVILWSVAEVKVGIQYLSGVTEFCLLLLSRSLSNSFSLCDYITEFNPPWNYLNFPFTSVISLSYIMGLDFSYESCILFMPLHEIKYSALIIFLACIVLKYPRCRRTLSPRRKTLFRVEVEEKGKRTDSSWRLLAEIGTDPVKCISGHLLLRRKSRHFRDLPSVFCSL